MALEDILEKIKKETELKITQIEQDFNERIKKLEEKYEKKKKGIDKRVHGRIKEQSEKILKKAETLAIRESQNILLESKRELLQECMEEAIKKLESSDKYEDILVALLKSMTLGDDVTIIPAKGKENKTKSALAKAGLSFTVSEKPANILGGFIAITDKVEIDNSFETIIKKQLREELEISINKVLFT